MPTYIVHIYCISPSTHHSSCSSSRLGGGLPPGRQSEFLKNPCIVRGGVMVVKERGCLSSGKMGIFLDRREVKEGMGGGGVPLPVCSLHRKKLWKS